VEPHGVLASARHYIRELVYGANDGLITTFAVVAGVSGGRLPHRAILIIGTANLLADGLSMAVGNYQAIRAHEGVLAASDEPEEEPFPARHALMTFTAFVIAGAVPLLPYAAGVLPARAFPLSLALTLLMLFSVGASRAVVSTVAWWKAGLDMLWLGVAVAAVAYAAGLLGARYVGLPSLLE
jgi:vacuolar iron transporter family protein